MEDEKGKNKGKGFYMALLIGVVFVWGLAPNVSKYLLEYYSPAIKTAFTALIAFVALLLVSSKKLKKLNKDYFKIGVPTGVVYSTAYVLQQIGLSKTTPTMYAFLENLSCLVVPVLVWIMTKIRPTYNKFIGAAICLFSVFILGGGNVEGGFGIGYILCGVAGILYGVNIAVTGVKAKDLDASLYLTVQFGVNLIISTIFAFSFEKIVFTWNAGTIGLCIGITLVSTVVGWLVRTICLKHIEASLVAVIMPFSAVVTSLFSVLLGSDVLSIYLVLGALLGLVAALISGYTPKPKVKKKRKKKYPWLR